MTFDALLVEYMQFRKRMDNILSRPIEDEIGLLQAELGCLESARWQAGKFRASMIGHYYAKKREAMQRLVLDGMAKTAIQDFAKAEANKELWAREDSHALYDSIDSRSWRIAQLLKMTRPGAS
jgi:hypothetical protein